MDENRERRSEVRIELREPLMASAEFRGTCFPAELVDLSESGAKFRLPECETPLEIRLGYETGWTVCLPSGRLARFKAAARWFRRLPDEQAQRAHSPEVGQGPLLRGAPGLASELQIIPYLKKNSRSSDAGILQYVIGVKFLESVKETVFRELLGNTGMPA